jgi:hypothetical protein
MSFSGELSSVLPGKRWRWLTAMNLVMLVFGGLVIFAQSLAWL